MEYRRHLVAQVGVVLLGAFVGGAGCGGTSESSAGEGGSRGSADSTLGDESSDPNAEDESPDSTPGDDNSRFEEFCDGLEIDGVQPSATIALDGLGLTDGYGIDETEVTQAQYCAWLATSPAPSTAEQCIANASLFPDADCAAEACQGAGCEQHPQVCVDWCDAGAYCRSVGKRLCGERTATSGDEPVNEWMTACTSGGLDDYGYEGSGDAPMFGFRDVCHAANGLAEQEPQAPVPVGTHEECHTRAGVSDMTGNVREWGGADAPVMQGSDYVGAGGGSYLSGTCSVSSEREATEHSPSVGFRCCSDE